MAVMWSYGTTKVIQSEALTITPVWSYGKSLILHDGTAAVTYETDGVGLDARLYKRGSPILDGTFSKATDYEFDSDIQEQMTSKGY